MNPVRYFGGLDLGQAHEFSALAVLERTTVGDGSTRGPEARRFALRYLERFPPGTPYANIFAEVARVYAESPVAGSSLAVDQTAVRKAIVDQLQRAVPRVRLRRVILSSGHAIVSATAGEQRVPKTELVGIMQLLFQGRRLKVALSLPDAQLLIRELANFKAKLTLCAEQADA